MNVDKTLTEILEIDKEDLSVKCAQASRMLIEARLGGGMTEEGFVEFAKTTFSYNELILMTIGYLTDKTNVIMNQANEIENIIERTGLKHGIPAPVMDAVKKMVGIKNPKNTGQSE